MGRATTKRNQAAKLMGFLVLGAVMAVYQLEPASHDAEFSVKDWMPPCSEQFEQYLHDIAVEWA
jgi:hypothetical protein